VLTLKELKEKIINEFDEVDLIDLLGLTTEQIVNAFEDLIEENSKKIMKELEIDCNEEDI
jgi:hypothetical protein